MITRAQAGRLTVAFNRLRAAVHNFNAARASRPLPPYYQQRQERDRQLSEFFNEMAHAVESGNLETIVDTFRKWETRSPQVANSLMMY